VTECLDMAMDRIRAFIRNDSAYLDWRQAKKEILQDQVRAEMKRYEKFGVVLPASNVSVKVYHYWKDNMVRDLGNKLETINDLLVDCGIVADDSWQVIGKIESDGELYRGEILEPITTIDVTVRMTEPKM